MNKYFKSLEFDVVLDMLSQQTSNADTKEMALKLKPSRDIEEVEMLLNQTEYAFELLYKFGAPSFSGLKNVNNSLARAKAGAPLNPKELLEIAYDLKSIRSIYEWYNHNSQNKSPLDFFFENITVNKYLETKIFTSIVNEEEVSDAASPELADIRRKIRSKTNSIHEKLNALIHNQSYQKYLQESIITQRNGRYVVPVKIENRADVKGLVHDTSSSGATVFIEPVSVVEINNDIKILQGKENEEIQKILYALSIEVSEFADSIRQSYDSAINLDLIFAKAQLAYKMKAIKPVLNSDGITDLKKARNPILPADRVVPINIFVGNEFDTLVITGPNTGGKTVSLKTVGLLTLMAECGLLIPAADQSKIAIYDNILIDIGDEQNIQQNLSTFSSHIKNIVRIVNKATSNSLVLIDELGAGTDPIEGAALAISIIEYLRGKHAKIIATTHYAELKAYALETDGVSNGSCEFDINTLEPTYNLIIGVPGRSNAFAIADRLGIKKSIIKRAKSLVNSEDRSFENVLFELEKSRLNLEEEKKKAEVATAEAGNIKANAEVEKKRIEDLKNTELQRAKHQAEKIIDNAKRQSADFLLTLEKLKKEVNESNVNEIAKKTKREIRNQIGDMEENVNPKEFADNWDDNYKLPRPVVEGDSVIIRSIGEGTVLEVTENTVLVQSGMLKTRVKMGDLMLTEPKKKPEQTTIHTVYRATSKADADFKTELDLRGQTVDEALANLDLFIDKCILGNIDEIRIIHGKGTGALRSAITENLRHNPHIKEFRLGNIGEGDTGVTIAKIK